MKLAIVEVPSGTQQHKLDAVISQVSDVLRLPKDNIVILNGLRLTVLEVPDKEPAKAESQPDGN